MTDTEKRMMEVLNIDNRQKEKNLIDELMEEEDLDNYLFDIEEF